MINKKLPGGDRTGPRGFGSKTGRGLGYCAGYETQGSFYGPGFRYGRGRGLVWGPGRRREYGRGWMHRRYYPPPPYETTPLEPTEKLEVRRRFQYLNPIY